MSAAPLTEIALAFLKLGCIAFGGPVAHLSYLHAEFVRKRQWLDDVAFADLVALCQFLPGPASSQLVFALGMQRAGIIGAFVASLCFTLPSAVLMIAFAYSLTAFGALTGSGWIHGLKIAAVAVVAQAVLSMGKKLCPDRPRILLGLAVALAVLLLPNALTQLAAIALSAGIGWAIHRNTASLTTTVPATSTPAVTAAVPVDPAIASARKNAQKPHAFLGRRDLGVVRRITLHSPRSGTHDRMENARRVRRILSGRLAGFWRRPRRAPPAPN